MDKFYELCTKYGVRMHKKQKKNFKNINIWNKKDEYIVYILKMVFA